MADSDGKPPDSNDPRFTPPSPAKPVVPAPRLNPPNVNAQKEPATPAGPPGFQDFMEWMRSHSGGGEAPASNQRSVLPKEKKKFQRHDAEAKSDRTPAPGAGEIAAPDAPSTPLPATGSAVIAAAPAPSGREMRAGPFEKSSAAKSPVEPLDSMAPRVRRQQSVAKGQSWFWIAVQLGVLALLAGSFLLGRASIKAPVTPLAAAAAPTVVRDGQVTTKLLSDANAALIDQAMAAEQGSHFKEAGELLDKVHASGEHIYGLTYQMALLALYMNDGNKAVPLLNQTLSENEDLGNAYNLRATYNSRLRVLGGKGMNDYETATKVDPFDARHYYYWGEALRRAGKFQAALIRLHQAFDRLREPALESTYLLTIRLAQIESGQENLFADELARQLAIPHPSMDWYMTAAAVEMQHGNFTAAAADLGRARDCGDVDGFTMRLHDYFFDGFKFEKDIAPFYAHAAPARPGSPDAIPAPSPTPTGSVPQIGLDMPPSAPPAASAQPQ